MLLLGFWKLEPGDLDLQRGGAGDSQPRPTADTGAGGGQQTSLYPQPALQVYLLSI